jgi:hypothetical protein
MLVPALQLSRFSMKNMLNAMTDLQRIQHMLLGTTEVFGNIRSGLRMRALLGVFKRAAATAQRRWVHERFVNGSCSNIHSKWCGTQQQQQQQQQDWPCWHTW